MRKLSNKAKQRLIDDMLLAVEYKESDFPVVNDLSKLPPKYRGMALQINERGNVTVWKCFKNGTNREIASRV